MWLCEDPVKGRSHIGVEDIDVRSNQQGFVVKCL